MQKEFGVSCAWTTRYRSRTFWIKSCKGNRRPAWRSFLYMAKWLGGLKVTWSSDPSEWRWKAFGIQYFSQFLIMSFTVIIVTSYIDPFGRKVRSLECFAQLFFQGSKTSISARLLELHSSEKELETTTLPRSYLLNDFYHWKTSLENTG